MSERVAYEACSCFEGKQPTKTLAEESAVWIKCELCDYEELQIRNKRFIEELENDR